MLNAVSGELSIMLPGPQGNPLKGQVLVSGLREGLGIGILFCQKGVTARCQSWRPSPACQLNTSSDDPLNLM